MKPRDPRHRPSRWWAGLALVGLALQTGCGGDPGTRPPLACMGDQTYEGALPMHAPLGSSDWPAPDDAAWLNRPLPQDLAARLDARVDALLALPGAAGMTAAIGVPGVGLWTRSAGLARRTPAAEVVDSSLFWWASVGKAFTAQLLLQSIAHGRLSEDDAVARWWPAMPQADRIRLSYLLHHTSGLRSFNSGEFEAQLPGKAHHPPEALIAAVQDTPLLSCPGTHWSYSNTGYVMLGRVLERTEGRAFAELMRQRVFEPLGLDHIDVLEAGAPPAGMVTRHPNGAPLDDPAYAAPFAAGNVVARADEVIRFWHAALQGSLVPQATARASFDALYPMFDGSSHEHYGRGVMVSEWTDARRRPRRWLGHRGGAPGANAVVAYDPLPAAYVAVAINADVSAVATANALLQTLENWREGRSP